VKTGEQGEIMADDPMKPGQQAAPATGPAATPDPNAAPAVPAAPAADPNAQPPAQPAAEPAKESRAQRRIQQLVAEKNYWKGRADAAGSGTQPQQPQNTPPTREQYGSDAEYIDALTDWKLNNALPTVIQRVTEAQTREVAERRFNEQVSEVSKKYPDWDEVLEATESVMMPTTHLEIIQQSSVAPEVVYALGKNPALAEKISRMTPITAAREIGRIEASITAQSKPGNGGAVPKPASGAPAPITPVPGGTVKPEKSVDEMSMAEYREWRKQMQKKT
jgi:hypothetical protein